MQNFNNTLLRGDSHNKLSHSTFELKQKKKHYLKESKRQADVQIKIILGNRIESITNLNS